MHKTLTFLFDGVPSITKDSAITNNTTATIDSTLIKKKALETKVFYHPPYQEKMCDNCHNVDERGKLTQSMPDLCYSCHENFKSKYKFLHAPVESGACNECHNPHMTKINKLLLREGQALCLNCHELKQVLANEIHAEIGETNCTECHNPHGGEDKLILK